MKSSISSSSTQKTIRDVHITKVLAVDESDGRGDQITIENNTVDVLAPTKDIRRRFKFDHITIVPDQQYCLSAVELVKLSQNVLLIAFGHPSGWKRIGPLARYFMSQISSPLRVSATKVYADRIEICKAYENDQVKSTHHSLYTTWYDLVDFEDIEKMFNLKEEFDYHLILSFETAQGAKVTFVEVSSAQSTQLSPSKKEIFVNSSLSTLVNVLRQLSEDKQHISFRDSKLTTALQKVIVDSSEIYFVAFIISASSHAKESLSTIGYVQSLWGEPYNTVSVSPPQQENIRETFHSLEEKIKFWRQRASSLQIGNKMKPLSLTGSHSAPASPLAFRSKSTSDEVENLRAQVVRLRARIKMYELRLATSRRRWSRFKDLSVSLILFLVLWLLFSPI